MDYKCIRAYIIDDVSLILYLTQKPNFLRFEECLPTQPLKSSQGAQVTGRDRGKCYSSDTERDQYDIILSEGCRTGPFNGRFG